MDPERADPGRPVEKGDVSCWLSSWRNPMTRSASSARDVLRPGEERYEEASRAIRASLREMPRSISTRPRSSYPYALRIAAEGISIHPGRGRPRKGMETGPTVPRSVRFPAKVWKHLEKRAKAEGKYRSMLPCEPPSWSDQQGDRATMEGMASLPRRRSPVRTRCFRSNSRRGPVGAPAGLSNLRTRSAPITYAVRNGPFHVRVVGLRDWPCRLTVRAREDERRARLRRARECPDEEEGSAGIGDRAGRPRPLHVDDGDARPEERPERMMTYPDRRSAKAPGVSVQQTNRMGTCNEV